MVQEKNLFHKNWNKHSAGVLNNYEIMTSEGKLHFSDRATGLMWSPFFSAQKITWYETLGLVMEINRSKSGGFENWRMPTLEEAMTLLDSWKNSHGLYRDPIFDKKHPEIWTNTLAQVNFVDEGFGLEKAWVVNFKNGKCEEKQVHSKKHIFLVRSTK